MNSRLAALAGGALAIVLVAGGAFLLLRGSEAPVVLAAGTTVAPLGGPIATARGVVGAPVPTPPPAATLAQAGGPATAIPPGALPATAPALGMDQVDVATAFTPSERLAIQAIVRDYLLTNPSVIREYLLANPEVLQEAVTALETKQRAAQQEQQTVALAAYRDQLENSPRHVVLGNPEGDVTLVEFFDYNCTYCKRSLADVDKLIADDPNLRVVLKEFPVLGPGSIEAAQVAVAVNMVAADKYSEFHDMLLGGQAPASTDRAIAVAEAVGIDVAKVREAMANETEINKTLEESFAIADALSLTGTPTYILANEVVVGAVGYDALKSRIDAVRACGNTVC